MQAEDVKSGPNTSPIAAAIRVQLLGNGPGDVHIAGCISTDFQGKEVNLCSKV